MLHDSNSNVGIGMNELTALHWTNVSVLIVVRSPDLLQHLVLVLVLP